MSDDLFRDPLSFGGLPVSQDFEAADVAVLGMPFDCGEHETRIGSRSGPTWIRQHSILAEVMAGDADPAPLSRLKVIDAGDVNTGRDELRDIHMFYDRAELAMNTVLDGGCAPVTMGGDGAVSLPQIRAVAARHPGLAILHFDAHTDAYPLKRNDHFDNATTFTHAASEGRINVEASIHVGTRAVVNTGAIVPPAHNMGYRVIPYAELDEMTVDEAVRTIREPLEGLPVYLCFDMDFFDPAFAPGVCTPTPGGASAHFGLTLLRRMSGLNIVACDVNTVSPPHDPDGSTANLAATVVLECISLVADALV